MADHHQYFSHDALNRYLLDDKVSPAVVWLAVLEQLIRGNLRLPKHPRQGA
jgi:hypothetical protein